MESTPSYIPNKFYCNKCKQEYPFSSKEYHCFLCGGEQINNNTIIKNDFDLLSEVFTNSNNNEVIDINAAPYYPQEDNHDNNSIQQPKYPLWKEEYEENISEQPKEEKKKEEEKKEEEGIMSKIKEYGTSIKDYGTTIGKVATGLGLCAFGTYIGSPAVVNFGLNVIANNIGENNNNTDSIQNPPPSNCQNSNENVHDRVADQYRIERLRLEQEAQEREKKEKEERERRQREAQERREKEEREIRQNEERERRQNNNNNHRHNKPPLDSESIRLARLRNIDRYGVLNQINDRRDDNRQNPIEEEDIINLLLLPVTEIKDNDHKPKGNCIICLGDFYPKEKVTSLPCLHIFHHKCIQVWLKSHKVCPVCKLKLNGHGLGTE